MEIREMEYEDIDRVLEIEMQSFTVPWRRIDFEYAMMNSECIYLIAWEDDRIIGYLGCSHVIDEIEIQDVATAPEARRKGVARKLIETIIERGDEAGVVRYLLEVRESNAPAIALYESFKFERVGIRKEYYRYPTEDAILMTMNRQKKLRMR